MNLSERKLAVGCFGVAESAFEGVRERRGKVDTPAMHSFKQAGNCAQCLLAIRVSVA